MRAPRAWRGLAYRESFLTTLRKGSSLLISGNCTSNCSEEYLVRGVERRGGIVAELTRKGHEVL